MNKLGEFKTGITTRANRDGRMADIDLIDATDDEVEVWFEQKRRYGESVLTAALKTLLTLIRSLHKENVEEQERQQEMKKGKK